ncbi:leucine zipper putative tumor suppressor 2-like isoform X1 [Lytechinus pictus]|uniref:leucine zipper putative tumor suppressor 2-like isoform X1 n=1 Tax=Lytechinus pictus TaxID=7653 RepID=UPI0030B9EAC2
MAACDMVTSSSSSSYGLHQASLIHIPPSSADQSPTTVLSNGTMGSTSSLLADSGYRGYSDTTTNSNSSVFEEPPAPNDDTESIGPPKLTPISGKLEKTKEKKLIKPIAVRFASPNTSPTDTYKQISPQSPSLSDTMATYSHPPDILMTNNNHGFSAGKHFGKPPTKAMSLQDITPMQQTYRTNGHQSNHSSNGHHQSTLPHKGDASQRSALHQKLHQAQSLNFINRGGGWANIHQSGTVHGKIGNGGRHRSHSQSMYPGDGQRPLVASHGQDTKQHSHPNLTSPRNYGEDHVYAPVSVSSVPEESDLAEENRILRNKVQNKHDQDMKHQLVTMRDTMEVNEQTIFQVQDEKRRDYEGRINRLQTQLQQEKDSSLSQQRSQQQEIYRLEQDRKQLKLRLEDLQKELSRHKDNGKKVEEQQSVLAESQQEITNKRYEIKRLEESVKRSKDELQYEKENVKRLQIELDKARLQVTKRTNGGQQHLLSKKESELSQVKADAKKTMDQRDSLMLRVKNQGDEIDRLGALVKTREQELAQERCEVAYLKEVNERMTSALKEKEEKVEKTKGSVEGSSHNSKKIDVVELELGRTVEKLQQLQTEKDMESARLQKRIAEKDADIKRLQGRLRERGKGNERNGVDNKTNPTQRRLEQDRLELQAKLVKREQELRQARQQVLTLQTQERNSGPALSNSILQKKEAELKTCQEKLHQRHAEITYIREKLGERDAEMTALKVKLDRVHRQLPENGRRSGSLDRELSGTRAAKQQLESHVKSLREENARLKEKLSRVAVGVRTLSESHLNLAKLSMVPSVPDKPKFERTDPKAVGQLQKEVASLKQEISRLNEDKDKQTSEFRQEHGIWQEEKHRVIAYQKQLQLNYVQMCQKNKKLEQEVQQLTKELDNEEVIQC